MTSRRIPGRLRFAAWTLLAISAALPAGAQTVTGTLQGTVYDSDRGALPGASISLRGSETGLERNLVTNERGFYNATFLPIGMYRVTASLPGFGTVVRDGVVGLILGASNQYLPRMIQLGARYAF